MSRSLFDRARAAREPDPLAGTIVVEHRHFTLIAQNSQLGKEEINANLGVLERRGYARQMASAAVFKNESTRWRIKPPAVDPDEWVHRRRDREEQERSRRRRLEQMGISLDGERDLGPLRVADGGDGDNT